VIPLIERWYYAYRFFERFDHLSALTHNNTLKKNYSSRQKINFREIKEIKSE
jgi:hypothetical protein